MSIKNDKLTINYVLRFIIIHHTEYIYIDDQRILRRPIGIQVTSKILLRERKKNKVKLGRGQKKFCKAHGLKKGDTLVFTIIVPLEQRTIKLSIHGCFLLLGYRFMMKRLNFF